MTGDIDALNTALNVIGVVGAAVTLLGGALMLADVDLVITQLQIKKSVGRLRSAHP